MFSDKNDWNPSGYMKFGGERTQPSIDLVNRIKKDNPVRIVDVGCGPGNSTAVLKMRYPSSNITGIDSSQSMIESAKEKYPDMEWIVQDASTWTPSEKYDIIFSNAAIQWIPGHEDLLNRLMDITSDEGVIAMQVPQYLDMPAAKIIEEIYTKRFPDSGLRNISIFTIHSADFYFDVLYPRAKNVELWETFYCHVMDSANDIYNMLETTGIRPYLDEIEDESVKAGFIDEVKAGLAEEYKANKSGKVIFPFKRLFFTAYK